MSFDWLWFLPVAVLLGVAAVAGLVLEIRRRRRGLLTFAEAPLLERLVPSGAFNAGYGRSLRLGGAVALAAVALAGPRWGMEQRAVRGEGVDVVLALDASLSMLAQDVRPSRLEQLKQEVRRLFALSPADRFAMLAWAGRSYILTPMTRDDGALELFLDNLDPSIVGLPGTMLSRTISQATDLLMASGSPADKAIVLMSDGEDWDAPEDVITAAKRAASNGITIVSVGFGTEEGTTIPIRDGDRITTKRDAEGNIVITRHRPDLMLALARETGGTFIEADASDKASRVRQALSGLRTAERTIQSGRAHTPRFQWLLIPALLLLVADTWLRERRRAPIRLASRALAGAALLFLAVGCRLPSRYAADAAKAYEAGDYARAAALYRYALERAPASATLAYDYGTALVTVDSLTAAAEPLERSIRARDEELRFRSLFNLGLVHLKRGLAGAPGADSTRQALKA
ncbi:MAG: VWA domain-containing protein, partial [Gemmatimonadota bacterium]